MLYWLFPEVRHPLLLLLCLALSFLPLREMFRLMFEDLAGLAEDLETAAPPDAWSFLRGKLWEDRWAEMKLGFFALCCIALPTALYRLGSQLLA